LGPVERALAVIYLAPMTHRRSSVALATVAALTLMASGCSKPKGNTGDDKRRSIQVMKQDTLARLYAAQPEARGAVQSAAGYAVFSNVGLTVLLVGGGNGYGVVVDNATGRQTYMRMTQGSVGVGLGVKDFRAVIVFHDRETLSRFVTKGWEFGGEAEASAKSDDKGGQATAAGSVQKGLSVYQFTESGVALQASAPLTKYSRYDELN